MYSVILVTFEVPVTGETMVLSTLSKIWKSKIPRKIQVFCWRSFLNRLPTKDQLNPWSILTNSNYLFCHLCSSTDEEVFHFFWSCDFSKALWIKVFSWLGIESIVMATSLYELFTSFSYSFTKEFIDFQTGRSTRMRLLESHSYVSPDAMENSMLHISLQKIFVGWSILAKDVQFTLEQKTLLATQS